MVAKISVHGNVKTVFNILQQSLFLFLVDKKNQRRFYFLVWFTGDTKTCYFTSIRGIELHVNTVEVENVRLHR